MAWYGSWCPPTAYECSPSPCICLYWIWGPFHVGLEPQSLHNDNKGVCSTEQWSRITADFQNMSTMLCWYWHDDGSWCPLTAYECSPAPYISLVDTETILCGSGASITGQWGCFQYAAVTQDFSRFPKYVCIVVLMHADVSLCPLTAYELWWILMSIHSIWIFSNTLHMSVVDLARVWSLNLWTMMLFQYSSNPGILQISKLRPHCWWLWWYWLEMDPCLHPQHMNALQHLVYVWNGYGDHCMRIWSLDHLTMTLFAVIQQ